MNDKIEVNKKEALDKQFKTWHKPAITRIELKRTLDGGGSFADFLTKSSD